MAYEGFLEFSGTELVNVERTEAYVANLSTVAFTPRFGSKTLHLAQEEDVYRSPTVDDAPWFEEGNRCTTDFYGVYPLEITGLDDSTLTASVTEGIGDGGSVTGARDATRAVRVHALLIGSTPEGAQAGLAWLREAVRSDSCGDESSCSGGDLRYFVTEPTDVTRTAYSDAELAGETEHYGTLSGPVLIDHRWTKHELDPDMPNRLRWNLGAMDEGTVFEIGGLGLHSPQPVTRSGLIEGNRHNYVLNPSLRSDTANWQPVGTTELDWLPNGGIDGAGGGGAGGAFDPDAGCGVIGLCAPVPTGPATASVWVRADVEDALAFRVLDGSGEEITSATIPVGTDWTRATLTVELDESTPLSLMLVGAAPFAFDHALVEPGTLELDYFDGSTDDDPDYVVSWLGAPDASSSRRVWVAGYLEQVHPDSRFRPYIEVLQGSIDNVFLTWFPKVALTMSQQLNRVERVLHDVECTQGPQVVNSYFTDLGSYIEVDFIFVAGNPHPFSNGTVVSTYPLLNLAYTDRPDTGELDAAWLVDPRQPVITAPPLAPTILDPSLETITHWERYYVGVPADVVQEWGMSVPVLGIDSHDTDLSQVRLRFHPNPFGYAPARVDPTAYCSELIVSYLPARTRLVIDGMNERAIASKGGKATVSADHLLYGAGGSPIAWPELSCGIPYVLTIDVPRVGGGDAIAPPSTYADLFDVDLTIKRRG